VHIHKLRRGEKRGKLTITIPNDQSLDYPSYIELRRRLEQEIYIYFGIRCLMFGWKVLMDENTLLNILKGTLNIYEEAEAIKEYANRDRGA